MGLGARPMTPPHLCWCSAGTVNVLPVNMISGQESVDWLLVSPLMRRWGGSSVPARGEIVAASLAGRPRQTSGDVVGGHTGRGVHRPRGNAGRAWVTCTRAAVSPRQARDQPLTKLTMPYLVRLCQKTDLRSLLRGSAVTRLVNFHRCLNSLKVFRRDLDISLPERKRPVHCIGHKRQFFDQQPDVGLRI
jgi:hypothetical protein